MKAYQTLNYAEKLIADTNEQECFDYSPGFGRLYKWLTTAIALRKQDIIRRKAVYKRNLELREAKLKERDARELEKQAFIE